MQNKKIKYRHAKPKEIMRTGRIGTIYATFDQLKKVFGEPYDCTVEGEWESRDNKVRVEWAFILDNNKKAVFTVYYYKNNLDLDKIKMWSLGGKKLNQKIHNFLRSKKILFKFLYK